MPLSAQEQELIALQTELLREAQQTVLAGRSLNDLMAPILLEEAGYDVVRATEDKFTSDYQFALERVNAASAAMHANEKYFHMPNGGTTLALNKNAGLSVSGAKRAQLQKIADEYNQANEQFNRAQKFEHRAGEIIGLNQRAPTPTETLREENEQMLLERQQEALRGELPVAPGLLADLEEQEEQLRASLEANLGPGYETSTPAIEALAEFQERSAAIVEAARRDDIATAGGLANQMGQFTQGVRSTNTGVAQMTAGNLFSGGSALSQIASGYSGPAQFLQNNRMMDFQMAQANNSPGLFESLFAQGAGTAMTFGLADLFDV